MGKREPNLPPGPSRRPEQMSEKDQEKLREYQRTHHGKEKEREEEKNRSGGDPGRSTTEE